MIQQTSLLAYREIKPTLNDRQAKVLQAIEAIYPACNAQVAQYLGWPINTVTPRVLELRGKFKVVKHQCDVCKSSADPLEGHNKYDGRKVNYWQPRLVGKDENGC